MKKRLIVNADDFGIHETVNKAVYRGFESGILTSTSIMAGDAPLMMLLLWPKQWGI